MRWVLLVAFALTGCVSFEDYCGQYYQSGTGKWADCVVEERRQFSNRMSHAFDGMKQQNSARPSSYNCRSNYTGGYYCDGY